MIKPYSKRCRLLRFLKGYPLSSDFLTFGYAFHTKQGTTNSEPSRMQNYLLCCFEALETDRYISAVKRFRLPGGELKVNLVIQWFECGRQSKRLVKRHAILFASCEWTRCAKEKRKKIKQNLHNSIVTKVYTY